MREILVTAERLSTLSKERRNELATAIAQAVHDKRMGWEGKSAVHAADMSDFRKEATRLAGDHFHRVPTQREVDVFMGHVVGRTAQQRKDDDWFTAQNIITNVARFGPAVVAVTDGFSVPWPLDNLVSIEAVRPASPPEVPLIKRAAGLGG